VSWHEGMSLIDQINLKWYLPHTHRRSKASEVWIDCRLVSMDHPLYSKAHGSHADCQDPLQGINHVCRSSPADGPLDKFAEPSAAWRDKVRGRQKVKQMLWYVYAQGLISASTFNGPEFRTMLCEGALMMNAAS
jgi:hypothetical protein